MPSRLIGLEPNHPSCPEVRSKLETDAEQGAVSLGQLPGQAPDWTSITYGFDGSLLATRVPLALALRA